MLEILLTVGGVILGVLLTAGYERAKERRSAHHIRLLLSQELAGNRARLKEVIVLIDAFPANELPSHIKPMNMEEIVQRVETACHRGSFKTCRSDLPSLGTELMASVLRFYDSCQEVPRSFREIERWAGNIRASLFHDYINGLVEAAKTLEVRLAV